MTERRPPPTPPALRGGAAGGDVGQDLVAPSVDGRGEADHSGDLAPARGSALVAALPVGLAIGVFGVIYGAAARSVLGPGLAIASSVAIFSGAAQFTMLALLSAGAAPAGVVALVVTAP